MNADHFCFYLQINTFYWLFDSKLDTYIHIFIIIHSDFKNGHLGDSYCNSEAYFHKKICLFMLEKDDRTRTSTEIICPRIFVSFHLSQLLKLSRQRGEFWEIPGAGRLENWKNINLSVPTFISFNMKHKIVDFEQIQDLQKVGGLSEATLKKRKFCVGVFDRFVQSFKNLSLGKIITHLKSGKVISGEILVSEVESAVIPPAETTSVEITSEKITSDEVTDSEPFELLENCLMAFFQTCEVKEGLKPKMETADGYRSHLKMFILKETGGRCDIRDVVKFHKFNVSYTV